MISRMILMVVSRVMRIGFEEEGTYSAFDHSHLCLPLLIEALSQVDILEQHQREHGDCEPAGYVRRRLVQHYVKAVLLESCL